VKVVAFVISGVLAAAAGIVDYSLVSAVSPTAGQSLMFTVLAAVVIGGASLTGGQGTMIGALAGAFLLQVLTNGLGLLGAGVHAQMIFQGGIILLAIALDRLAYRSKNAQVAM
jgi:ribose/xylose/arabinose/galactoside ABC-type transport system permease subunit